MVTHKPSLKGMYMISSPRVCKAGDALRLQKSSVHCKGNAVKICMKVQQA